jgi:hypothetical protein
MGRNVSLQVGNKRMMSFGLTFISIGIVFLLQCKITAVGASTATTGGISTNLMSFGNIIAKVHQNRTDDDRTTPHHSQKSTLVDITDTDNKKDLSSCHPSALLDETKRRIWCFGPHLDSKVKNQRYYLPVRFLSTLRKEDIMILPGDLKSWSSL